MFDCLCKCFSLHNKSLNACLLLKDETNNSETHKNSKNLLVSQNPEVLTHKIVNSLQIHETYSCSHTHILTKKTKIHKKRNIQHCFVLL